MTTYTTINGHRHNGFMSPKQVQAYCFKNDIGKAEVFAVNITADYVNRRPFNWDSLEYEQDGYEADHMRMIGK